jgi:hypothetical protein
MSENSSGDISKTLSENSSGDISETLYEIGSGVISGSRLTLVVLSVSDMSGGH